MHFVERTDWWQDWGPGTEWEQISIATADAKIPLNSCASICPWVPLGLILSCCLIACESVSLRLCPCEEWLRCERVRALLSELLLKSKPRPEQAIFEWTARLFGLEHLFDRCLYLQLLSCWFLLERWGLIKSVIFTGSDFWNDNYLFQVHQNAWSVLKEHFQVKVVSC